MLDASSLEGWQRSSPDDNFRARTIPRAPARELEGITLGKGTSHLPAFCLRFCLMVLLKTLALSTCKASIESLSAAARMKKYVAVKKTSAKVNRLE